ncbi:MAG: SDR family NAD(P)-dependent oxidoreductase [Myxococcota bacterium]
MDYRGKRILITGASSGIGRALASALSHHRTQLVVTARRRDLLDSLAAQVEANGSACRVMAGDATDPSHAERVIETLRSEFGGVDIAVLNVGAGPPTNTTTESADSILGTMKTNYDSLIRFFVPLVQQMKDQAEPSLIAHVNSLAGYFGLPMQGGYAAAKAAGRIFLETARMELEHFGHDRIRIQTIHPGFVATDATSGDGIPAPAEISESRAAEFILAGIESEVPENRFPARTALAVRIGRLAPYALRKRLLLSEAPTNY